MNFLTNLAKKLQSNFAIFTIVLSAIAYFFPQLFMWAGGYSNYFMMLVMFGMSLTMEIEDFKELARKPVQIIIGLAMVFGMSTLVAFILVKLLNLPVGLAIGLLLVGATPGGMITNVMTFIAEGNTPLSVGLTSVGTLVAPILTPLLAYFTVGLWTPIDAQGMIVQMLQVVILPLVVGLLIKIFFRETAVKVQTFSPLLSLIGLSFMIGIIVSLNRDNLLNISWNIYLAAFLFIVFSMTLALLVSKALKFDIAETKSITIEAGLKNAMLASVIASANFADHPTAALPGIIVSLIAAVIGPIIANFWAKMSPGEEKIKN